MPSSWIETIDAETIAAVATAVTGLATSVALIVAWVAYRASNESSPPQGLEHELKELAAGMSASIKRLRRIEQELEARRATAEKLKLEAERNRQLASVNKEAADAVNDLIAGHFKDSSKKSLRLTVVSSALSLFFGAALSWLITTWAG